MKGWLIYLAVVAALGVSHSHYTAWSEEKCAELKNTPQQCALLTSESL